MRNEGIYTPPPYPGKPRARRLPPDAPMPERHLVLEDFEGRGEDALHAIWHQWGELAYRLDPDHKCRGSYGCTHEVGGVNTSFFAFPPLLPYFSCAGMNAWRLWAKGDGSGKSATFFIKDGSQEVYCWVIPEFLRDTQPYVLELPFGAYDYIYREEDRVFDPDGCGEFGYWITGPCRFSIDDIALVYDPTLPDFFGTPAALRPEE